MHSVLVLQCSIKVGLCSIASIIEREIVLYMFVCVFFLRIVCMCMCVFLCLSVCIIWMSGFKINAVRHYRLSSVAILIYCFGGLCKIESIHCFQRFSNMHSDSCLVMINNTIDYLVLLAITFLLVIDFIYSFAVCF